MRSELPARWTVECLGDHVELLVGFPFKSAEFTDDPKGVRLLRGDNVGQGRLRWDGVRRWPHDMRSRFDRYELHPGDIVLAMDRPWIEAGLKYSAVRQDDVPCLLVQRVARLRGSTTLSQRFLRYVVGSPEFTGYVRAIQTGTAVPHISGKQIASFRLRLPPQRDQEHIAALLGALDDKIDSNWRLAGLLEEMVATMFRARFVDFVGVEEFEDSEMGRIPRGWVARRFSDAIEINPRVALRKGEMAPFIEMAAVEPWALRPRAIGERPYAGGARFERGDTLMARITPCIEHGKGAFIDFLNTPASGSTEFIVLRAKPPLTPEMVFLLSRDERVRSHAITNMTGSSGRQRVPVGCFDDLWVAVPPDGDCLQEVRDCLRAALAMTRGLWRNSLSLMALRDTLLPRLISGEIRVAA